MKVLKDQICCKEEALACQQCSGCSVQRSVALPDIHFVKDPDGFWRWVRTEPDVDECQQLSESFDSIETCKIDALEFAKGNGLES